MMSTPLTFPVLALGPDVGRWAEPGREIVDYFMNEDDFTTCTSWDLTFGSRQGMLLADGTGRYWRIERVKDLGVTRGFWERVLRFLLQQSVHRIAQELVEQEPLSFADLKERVCASIAANPDRWRDDEAVAGEDGSPRDMREMLGELQAGVRKAGTLPQLINALYDEGLPD